MRQYDLTFEHLNKQIHKISKELNNGKVKISNLESVFKTTLNKLEKISKIFGSSELEDKRALQKRCFWEEFTMMQKTTNI